MSLLAGSRLWLLLVAVALLAGYVWKQRRRKVYAVRFTNLALLDAVVPRRPDARRHLSAAAFLLAMVTLVTAFARPARDAHVPIDTATVVVAIDVSGSMAATDVAPSRVEAARVAASAFVKLLPDRFDVGLVVFDQTAAVAVAPTNDHAAVARAIGGLQVGGGTAIGEAIFAALGSLAATPQKEGAPAPNARVVLMSDGATNSGRPNDEAAAAAAEAHVPVTTIAYGTDAGTVTVRGQTVSVPVDKPALQAIARQTSGRYFEASSLSQLKSVYDAIRSSVSSRIVHQDVSGWFIGLGLILLALAGAASLLWSPRLP